MISAATDEELKSFQTLFLTKSSRDFSNNHLWLSVAMRPARSNFTRVQRLSCCLCILLSTMLANAMFYKKSEENMAGTGVNLGPFKFNYRQMIIGIEASLIVIPLNLLLVEIFQRAGTKPMKGAKPKESCTSVGTNDVTKKLSDLSDKREMVIGIHDQDTSCTDPHERENVSFECSEYPIESPAYSFSKEEAQVISHDKTYIVNMCKDCWTEGCNRSCAGRGSLMSYFWNEFERNGTVVNIERDDKIGKETPSSSLCVCNKPVEDGECMAANSSDGSDQGVMVLKTYDHRSSFSNSHHESENVAIESPEYPTESPAYSFSKEEAQVISHDKRYIVNICNDCWIEAYNRPCVGRGSLMSYFWNEFERSGTVQYRSSEVLLNIESDEEPAKEAPSSSLCICDEPVEEDQGMAVFSNIGVASTDFLCLIMIC